MIRLTGPGKIFIFVLVLFYAASFTSQSSLLLLLIGLIIGCALVNGVVAWRTVRQIEVSAPPSVHLAEGDRLSQPWKIANRSSRPAGLFSLQSAGQNILQAPRLPASATASLVPTARFLKRGVYSLSETKIVCSWPFGLVQAARTLDLSGEVVVYPALYETAVPRTSGLDTMSGGKFKGKRRVLQGSHFAGVRPVQTGDSLRQIHWKTSSKGRGLMVKTFEEELGGRVSFVLDPGHSGDGKILDDCVRATGSLLMTASDAGHQAEWVSLGDEERLVVPPFSDGHEILDRLARVRLERGSLTEQALRAAVDRVSPRSSLCLMLTALNRGAAEVANELAASNRAVSVYLPEGTALIETLDCPVYFYSEKEASESE